MSPEFKINEFIILKLENGITNIYVNGILFKHCKYLLLNANINEFDEYKDITCIEEVVAKSDKSLESNTTEGIITPEDEFSGHCSNLQVWVENDYDTRILHCNIAFPLLRKLAKIDPKARQVFKEEIIERLWSGYPTVLNFFFEEGYVKYLNKKEIAKIFQGFDFNKITKHSYKDVLSCLKNLNELEVPLSKGIFKKEIAKCFGSGSPLKIIFLLKEGYLKYLNKKELAVMFKGFDFIKIIESDYKDSLYLLKKLNELDDPIVYRIFIEEIKKHYRSDEPSVIKHLDEEGYFGYLDYSVEIKKEE